MIDDEPAILQFSGQMTPLDEQTYRIDYQLSQSLPYKSVNAVQYRDSGWKATIELKIGTQEVLMRNGETTYVLELSDGIKEQE